MGQLESLIDSEFDVAAEDAAASDNSKEQTPRAGSTAEIRIEKTDVAFYLLVIQTILLAYIAVELN